MAEYEAAQAEAAAKERAKEFDYEVEALEAEVDIDGFLRSDLRVARILEASVVPKMNKLLQLKVSLGPLGERNVFAGIRKSFAPEDLVGKHVVCVANLKPRTMRCGVSEGMVLATGPDAKSLSLVTLPTDSRPGDRIH